MLGVDSGRLLGPAHPGAGAGGARATVAGPRIGRGGPGRARRRHHRHP